MLYEILSANTVWNAEQLKNMYGEEAHPYLEEYLAFLLEKRLVFDCPIAFDAFFPPLDTNWDSPSVISNIILEIAPPYDLPIGRILEDVEELDCQDCQLRIPEYSGKKRLSEILHKMERSIIKSVEILIECQEVDAAEIEWAYELCRIHPRVYNIVFCGCAESSTIRSTPDNMGNVFTSTFSLLAPASARKVRQEAPLIPNMFRFTEALKYNLYFNRKVHIDRFGHVKNGEFQSGNFSNIKTVSLRDICNSVEFQQYWTANKDNTRVCRDCEFRYGCVDFRVPVQCTETSEYYYETPCNYDPYTASFQ
jgi:SPASM domain peptide maturase of grasp-with-spasm system